MNARIQFFKQFLRGSRSPFSNSRTAIQESRLKSEPANYLLLSSFKKEQYNSWLLVLSLSSCLNLNIHVFAEIDILMTSFRYLDKTLRSQELEECEQFFGVWARATTSTKVSSSWMLVFKASLANASLKRI